MKTILTLSFIVIGLGLTSSAWSATPRSTERDLDAVPQTYDDCVANGRIANCDNYPDAPKNKTRIFSEVHNYKECVSSNLAIDCGAYPGAPKKHRRASAAFRE